jgi:hypothetical protein
MTVPVSGRYYVRATVGISELSNPVYALLAITGMPTYRKKVRPTGHGVFVMSCSGIMSLTPDDIIKVYVGVRTRDWATCSTFILASTTTKKYPLLEAALIAPISDVPKATPYWWT